ncbi:MAG TPA: hypothetical protein VKI44_04190 [Acetobacteraceae bacterium]|nr:hypothetical protein [Acetobacteraceae bacterium]
MRNGTAVIQPAVVDRGLHELAHMIRRAGDSAALRLGFLELLGKQRVGIGKLHVVLAPQQHETVAPLAVAAFGDLQRLLAGFGNHDVAADAHQRQFVGRIAQRRPLGAVAVGDRAHGLAAQIGDDVHPPLRRPRHAIRPADAVPQRRMRLLQRRQFHRHISVAVVFPLEAQRLVGHAAQDHLQRLGVHRRRRVRIDPVIAKFDRRDAAPDAEQHAAAAHLVEHADFFQ